MSDREFEKRIKGSFEQITPDVLSSILADCDEKGQEMTMKESVISKKPIRLRRFASLAAAFIILFGSVIGVNAYQANKTVSARVSLDVNPSVEIQVNRKERVLDVIALNEDGRAIVGDMDFSGSNIDVAVNALVGSMIRNGYINEIANSILVTVSGDDTERDEALQTKITDEIDRILAGNSLAGAILSQVLVEDTSLDSLAQEYGITPGKARLIQEITESNPLYKIEDLVPLTINELNLLTLSNEVEFVDIKATGTASDIAYIGNAEAEKVALAHAGTDKEKAQNLSSRLEWEHGKMVYDVEFAADGYEYEYDIDALTGEVVEVDKEVDDDVIHTGTNNGGTAAPAGPTQGSTPNPTPSPAPAPTPVPATTIGVSAAQSKALADAGFSGADKVRELKVEYDVEEGVYDVSFKAGGFEYDYEIDAYTGAIVKREKEKDDDYVGQSGSVATATNPAPTPAQPSNPVPVQPSNPTPAAATTIGVSSAQSKALADAGFSGADKVRDLEVEYDVEDGVYDVSFKAGGFEYDYEIDAYTGAIVKREKEKDDDYVGQAGSVTTATNPAPAPAQPSNPTPVQPSNPTPVQPSNPAPATTTTTAQANSKTVISSSDAQSKALSHAGLSVSQARELKVEYDRDDAEYEVSFKSGQYEYDYEINAYTGAIIKWEKDLDD